MTLIPETAEEICDLGEQTADHEPIRKTTMAAWKIGRRPRRSEILPHSGVAAVEVKQVRRDHPGELVQPAQLGGDPG
jgi:hypothetical protein